MRSLRRTPLNVSRKGQEPSEELCQSVREIGVQEPILARQTGPESFVSLRGNLRTEASRRAGHHVIPAFIVECTDEEAASLVADHGHDPLTIFGIAAEVWQLVRLGHSWMAAIRLMGGLISTVFPESPDALAKRAILKGNDLKKALESRDNGRMQSMKGYASPIIVSMIEAGETVLVADVRKIGSAYFEDCEAYAKQGARCPDEGGPHTRAALKARQDRLAKREQKAEEKEKAKAEAEAEIALVPKEAWTASYKEAFDFLVDLREDSDGMDDHAHGAIAVLAWLVEGAPRPEIDEGTEEEEDA